MNFKGYMDLEAKAKKAGVENSSALKQLLHLIQAKEAARRHYKAYLNEMNLWEANCAELVEDEIRQAGEHHD